MSEDKIKIPVKEKDSTFLSVDFFYPHKADIIKYNDFFVLQFVDKDMFIGVFFESEQALKETLEKLLQRVIEQ